MSIEHLQEEALNHESLNHPYLISIRDGNFKNNKLILSDFAGQYGYYSSYFQKYLRILISKIEKKSDKSVLLHNLQEEQGNIDEEELKEIEKLGIKKEWVDGIDHPTLFKRFQNAIGVKDNVSIGQEVSIWRDQLLFLMETNSPEMCLGILGLGTEFIVKHIYKYIINGIENHTNLQLYDYAFFPLHTEVDEEHSKILLDITKDRINNDIKNETYVRYGMLFALEMRKVFFDYMLLRAKNIDI